MRSPALANTGAAKNPVPEAFFQFSLLGLVTSGYFALAGSGTLDWPTLALTFTALVVRACMVAGFIRVIVTERTAFYPALAYAAFYPLDFYFISGDFLAATVHGVCFLAAVKVLTARTGRDYLYTAAISFVELIAAALLSSRGSFFGFLTVYLIFGIAAMVSAEIRNRLQSEPTSAAVAALGDPRAAPNMSRRLAVLTLLLTAAVLMLTAGLFLIVPRTARMAATLFPATARLTGFSTSVDLGGFGGIARDNRAVMHVLSYSRPLPPGLRWRGTSLSRFDGRRWFEPALPGHSIPALPGPAVIAGELQRSRRDGHRLLYRVDIQNADTGTLFVAGIPEFINLDAFQNADPAILQTPSEALRVLAPARESLRYEVSAHHARPLPGTLSAAERIRYLQLPSVDPRITALGKEWAGSGSPEQHAGRIQQSLRSSFRYKLDGPPAPVADPLADFLFVRKEGYCEYFASAMAVMLRSQGTPARVVTGFQSGYFNPVSGMQVIRASDAHAWVEAWFEDRGWTTFDPTPTAPNAKDGGLLSRFDLYLDAADNLWQEWVISYDVGHQVTLAARFENRFRSGTVWPDFRVRAIPVLKRWGPLSALLLLAAFLSPRLYRPLRKAARLRRLIRSGGSAGEAGELYARMLENLAKRGHTKPPAATPLEFASGLSQMLPPGEAGSVARFTSLYNAVRFGGDTGALSDLALMLRQWGEI